MGGVRRREQAGRLPPHDDSTRAPALLVGGPVVLAVTVVGAVDLRRRDVLA